MMSQNKIIAAAFQTKNEWLHTRYLTSVLKESNVIKENTLAICLKETALWGEDKRKDGHHHRKRPFKTQTKCRAWTSRWLIS